jgi:pimeloyl-ACP methyl ester carboxylesterase
VLEGLGRIVCIPPRALWPEAGDPPADAGSWKSLADDLLIGWRGHRLDPVIAVGHSFGAVASLIAAVREPASVRALVLLDPTIFPRQEMERYATLQAAGSPPRLGLIDTALKRKGDFKSHEEAFAYWRGKDLFRDWSDASLERYVQAMLTPGGREGWTLAWPPVWEAWYYRSFFPHTWELVPQLDPSIPVLVVAGERSDTFRPEAVAELRNLMPDSSFASITAGHLFPQSHPDETRAVLMKWLASNMTADEVSVS